MSELTVTAAPKKTAYRLEREARELKIYKEYEEFMSYPGAQPGAAKEYIMKKFNIHAPSTIWFIRKRVEERMKKEGAQC